MSPNNSDSSHLAGVVVCVSGDPTWDKDENKHIREQFTDENVSRWLKYRGGRLDEEVTNTTTHLICSRAAYNARLRNNKVKAAKKLGCHIVTYEWLTDTLQLVDYGHKKKAPPKLYHPGKVRDDEAISTLFRKSEKRAKPVKKKPLTAADFTAVSGGDDARAAQEAAEIGSDQSASPAEESSKKSPEENDPPKSVESGEGKGTKVVDDNNGSGNLVNNESDKPAGTSENGAKAKDHGPPVDLSLYAIYKYESALHQAEVWKRGRRLILELYESKSAPNTYLFGMTMHPKPGSSAGIRHFLSKTPGEKEYELGKFRSSYLRHTGVVWPPRDSTLSSGSHSDRQPRAVPEKTTGSATHKTKCGELEKSKKENPTKSLAVPHRHRQVDLKTSFKRERSSSGNRPAKELKVTKQSVAGGSGKVTNGGSKTA